jgi:hypothetical protein
MVINGMGRQGRDSDILLVLWSHGETTLHEIKNDVATKDVAFASIVVSRSVMIKFQSRETMPS